VSARTKWFTGMVVGGVVGFILYKLLHLRHDERPPIRVRGGSVDFDTDCGWTEVGKSDEWMQDVDAQPVARYIVEIHKGSSTMVQRGNKVHINQGSAMLSLSIDNDGEPKLGPRSRLPKDTGSGHRRVRDTASRLERVHVIPGNNPVDLAHSDWIDISYE
jgi:hypothetical protein